MCVVTFGEDGPKSAIFSDIFVILCLLFQIQ